MCSYLLIFTPYFTLNPTLLHRNCTIFLMKNNMGYADQTEIVVTPNNPLGAEQSAEEIQKRITDGVVVEIPEE